jgi:hypothetical protein
MSKSKETSLVSVLASATADDLADIDASIAEKEQAIKSIEGEIASLRIVRKFIDVKLNGQPQRKKPERKAGGGRKPAPVRDAIYDLLAKHDVPMKPATIASQIGAEVGSVYSALKHEWFRQTPDGYEIARA